MLVMRLIAMLRMVQQQLPHWPALLTLIQQLTPL
jgi:hypothetical protein